jgi:hypothetical protein
MAASVCSESRFVVFIVGLVSLCSVFYSRLLIRVCPNTAQTAQRMPADISRACSDEIVQTDNFRQPAPLPTLPHWLKI